MAIAIAPKASSFIYLREQMKICGKPCVQFLSQRNGYFTGEATSLGRRVCDNYVQATPKLISLKLQRMFVAQGVLMSWQSMLLRFSRGLKKKEGNTGTCKGL